MNVKNIHPIAAVVFLILLISGGMVFVVHAQDGGGEAKPLHECPEYKNLKERSASIGGNAWNPHTRWIFNQFPLTTGGNLGVSKKGSKVGVSDGSELYGWSNSSRFGHICWGETCGSAGDGTAHVDTNSGYCNNPGGEGCLVPPVSEHTRDQEYYDNRSDSFAKLDYDHREPICLELDPRDSKTPALRQCPENGGACQKVFGSCAEGQTCESIYKPCRQLADNQRGEEPAYCIYPLKGWMKIRSWKEQGWVRLSGRIFGTSVPEEKRKPDGSVIDPGTFGVFENWDKLNCSDDAEYAKHKDACSYRIMYHPQKREFYGWAWSPLLKWISFSGATLYDSREWKNTYWCGANCTSVSYNESSRRSRWSTAYTGVWVKGIGGNLFSRKGFTGINPPPGEFNADYLIVTGRYAEAGEEKKGLISDGSWEARCDDIDMRSECVKVARKKSDSEIKPFKRREGALSGTVPHPSGRANREMIKRSTLGSFDISAFMPKENAMPGNVVVNTSGNAVKIIRNEEDIWKTQNINANHLGNNVYYYEGDLVIGSDVDRVKRIIPNATSNEQGGGTIVVRGNIILKRPLEYSILNSINRNPGQLASVAWIALKKKNDTVRSPISDISDAEWKEGGNIVIDSCLPASESDEALAIPPVARDKNHVNVRAIFESQQFVRVAGSFFAENIFATGTGKGGNGDRECGNLRIQYTETTTDAAGSEQQEKRDFFYDVPLEIHGVVIARDILFQRVYRGLNRGSETIINTGRMLVNPPPGISEFIRSLPLW